MSVFTTVKDFGAVGDGVTDDSAAFQSAINASNSVIVTPGTYVINTPLTAVSGMNLVGLGSPTLKTTVSGNHIIAGVSLSDIKIDGVKFEGAGSSVTPNNIFSGGDFTDTGLCTFNLSTDVRVTNCEFKNFYNGFSAIRSSRLWFERNRVSNWKKFGVELSESCDFTVDHNHIANSDATGAFESYGVMATGDSYNGNESFANSISFNIIRNIKCWDGIMTHEVNGLRVIGNDIRGVRNGIDIGGAGPAPDIRAIIVSDNYIQAATLDTHGGVAAHHSGIIVSGKSSSNRIQQAIITGNTVDYFFNGSGMVSSGDTADIVVTNVKQATVTGNIISNSGYDIDHPGILVGGGNFNALTVSGNSLSGYFASGGVRLASVTGDTVSITGNAIAMNSSAHVAVYISGSTIGDLAVNGTASNSTTKYLNI